MRPTQNRASCALGILTDIDLPVDPDPYRSGSAQVLQEDMVIGSQRPSQSRSRLNRREHSLGGRKLPGATLISLAANV